MLGCSCCHLGFFLGSPYKGAINWVHFAPPPPPHLWKLVLYNVSLEGPEGDP